MAAITINEQAAPVNGANVPLRQINEYASSICKIEEMSDAGTPIIAGTGFLICIPYYDGQNKHQHYYGIMSCTHVLRNVYEVGDVSNYQFTFEKVNPRFDVTPQFIAKIHRTPEDPEKSKRLDVTFLQFNIQVVGKEPAANKLKFLVPVTYEGTHITKEDIFKKGSRLFSVHYAGGYELHSTTGKLENDGWEHQLLTHSLDTDRDSFGAPVIDVSTNRVIAVNRGDVRSPESQNNCYHYPNGATNILPVVDFIRGIKNFDYIICNSAVEAESTDDTDRRSVENGRSDAASASAARQPAGRLTGGL
jgi:hypothetical protein